MKENIKSVFKRLLIPFIIACLIGLIYNIISIMLTASSVMIYYPLQMWQNSNELLSLIYPVFSTIPFCWILYYERKNGYLYFVSTRTSIKKYLINHYICGAFMGFACMFFISFSGLLLSLFIIQPQFVEATNEILTGSLWGEMQIETPLLYGFLLSLWRGYISILMYTFGYLISLISNHLFVILTGGFIYSILENFATALLNCPAYSLCTSFEPNRIDFTSVPLSPSVSIIIGPTILLLVCCCVLLPYYIIQEKKENGTLENKN